MNTPHASATDSIGHADHNPVALLVNGTTAVRAGSQVKHYERFAIPYSFKPQLSVLEAAIAALAAVLRILLGSLLFAVWGTASLVAWSRVHGLFWRLTIVLAMFALFVISLASLMRIIATFSRSKALPTWAVN